jgi:hypothetical protein
MLFAIRSSLYCWCCKTWSVNYTLSIMSCSVHVIITIALLSLHFLLCRVHIGHLLYRVSTSLRRHSTALVNCVRSMTTRRHLEATDNLAMLFPFMADVAGDLESRGKIARDLGFWDLFQEVLTPRELL